ncbi:MAG: S8 family serine peptidase, partial [Limisphaerales bacterium]
MSHAHSNQIASLAARANPFLPTNATAAPLRLSNTTKPLAQLLHEDTAILLRNAWVDTREAAPLAIPESLRAHGDPGAYVVQARGLVGDRFRAQLEAAGASIVSYIPNDAFLVLVSPDGARQLAAVPETQAVLPYEPYYKLDERLLALALASQPLPADQFLGLTLFPGSSETTLAALQSLGTEVVAKDRSPFGPVLIVRPGAGDLTALAQLRGVQEIEPRAPRVLLNDLTRVRLGVAADPTTNNYLGLTGVGVVVAVNDAGVDHTHPDLTGRVFAVDPNALGDVSGHGTHVAGIIAGNGSQSASVTTNAIGSVTNANFRGEAPGARLFAQSVDLANGPLISDAYLQETAARTNALISNNSWGYLGVNTYDTAAASYDAAARDALPGVSGSQPVLFVFAAGDSGGGTDDGLGGSADSLTSPGTAKNVITVGAIENSRNLTNAFFAGWTDSSNAVAAFSSRGNVGVGIEGPSGRFKPDVVAPGTFIISTRSQQWAGTIQDAVVENQDPNAVADLQVLDQGLGAYRYDSGTSMSAAAVSGVLALMQEFFGRQLTLTASPALFKALLINGARPASPAYDFQTASPINYEGWGLINLPNSIPAGLTRRPTGAPLWFVDQSAATALATGQSQSWSVTVAPDGQALPLRVTLVWTDPPGNPAAAVKLVNDLDLLVINNDTGEIFLGNNFPAGNPFSQVTTTNATLTNIVTDVVNNVENVFLSPPLGTNYTITVIGRRVNVNAVTAHPNGIVQDYALVVSCDDPTSTDAFTIAAAPTAPAQTQALLAQPVTPVTNGVPLLSQRVGANPPLSGVTNGVATQWNFYVFTNTMITNAVTGEAAFATNVAFVTFQPPDLARPRNVEADLDLYASRDPALITLDPAAVAAAQQSLGRGGTEVVFFTNAAPDETFYVGVKSEDQQGGEFGLIGLSSLAPFDQQNPDGSRTLNGNPTGLLIPDGSPDQPGQGVARAIAIATSPITIRRVIVQDTIVHESFGDLIGNLSHNNVFAVLDNHTQFGLAAGVTNIFTYDDSEQGDLANGRSTDGPGSLNNFIGNSGMGVWFFSVVDNALGHTGTVQNVTIILEPTQSGPQAGINGVLQANRTFYDVIDVPAQATNLLITVSQLNGPVNLYVRRGALPTTTVFDKSALIDPPQGSLSLGLNDSPPLSAGRYFIAIFNPSAFPVSFSGVKEVQLGLRPVASGTFSSTDTPMPLPDDALASSVIHVPDDRQVVDASVGVRIDHPRVSDLVMHLVSPDGESILLVENRGGPSAANFGSGDLTTGFSYLTLTEDTNLATVPIKFAVPPFSLNPPPATVFLGGFEDSAVTNYRAGKTLDGWTVLTNEVSVINTFAGVGAHSLDLENGIISSILPTTAGKTYALRFAYNFLYRAGRRDVSVAQVYIYPDPNNPQTVISRNFTAALGGSWQTATLTFTAVQAGTPVRIQATNLGTDMLLDSFALSEVGFVDYLPEEPLTQLAGHPAQGDWRLEVWDNRAGANGPPPPALLSWQLQLSYATTNFLAVPMANGICYTGTNIGNAVQYFNVDVPRSATLATNDVSGTGDLVLLFNQNGLPAPNFPGTTVVNNRGPGLGETLVLSANSTPSLAPGQRYYLGVYNNAAPNTTNVFTLCVNFDRTDTNVLNLVTLTNNLPFTNTIAGGNTAALSAAAASSVPGALNYYRFTVSSNAYQAAFMVFPENGDVDLVVARARPVINPLPTAPNPPKCGTCQFSADYFSDFSGTTPERILIQTNATIPLAPGDYYIGVQNADNHPVTYSIVASQLTGAYTVIPLSDNVPLDYRATVGPTITNYFRFTIGQNTVAARFDLYNLTGYGDLVVQTNGFFPDDAYDFYQRASASAVSPAGIIVRTNSFLPTLSGDWLLAVANRDTNTINFTIRATALTSTLSVIPLTNGVSFTNTIAGQLPGVPALLDFYQFTVSTNAGHVNFELFPVNGNVDLVVQKEPTLPTTSSYDYQSTNAGTANELISVGPGSRPTRLAPGIWYLGVYNRTTSPVTYAVRATEFPYNIIVLTNGVPYTNTLAPGALLDYYQFTVDNNATQAVFQLLNPTTPANFFIRKGLPLPDPSLYDYTGTGAGPGQQVTVLTNSAPVPLSPGDWFVGVLNQTTNSVTYAVLASEVIGPTSTNVVITPSIEVTTNGVCLTWDSVVGANYYVEGKPTLTTSNWTAISPTITATDTTTTYCLPLSDPDRFFRVIVGLSPISPPPTNIVITPALELTNNEICLTWASLIGTNYYVEGKPTLTTPNWAVISPTITAVSTTTTYCLSLTNTNHFFRVIVGISPISPPPTNIVITPTLELTNNEICLTWASSIGTNYYVAGKPTLTATNWAAVSPTITAVAVTTTYCLSLTNTNHYFLVIQGASPIAPPPPPTNIVITATLELTNNEICLTWASLIGTNYYVAGKPSLAATNWAPVSPTITAVAETTTYCLSLTNTNHFLLVIQGTS